MAPWVPIMHFFAHKKFGIIVPTLLCHPITSFYRVKAACRRAYYCCCFPYSARENQHNCQVLTSLRIVCVIDVRYRLVLNDTEISSCRTKSQYQYRYQYLRFANSIPITIPILQIFLFNTNTNTNTRNFQKGYQYQYQNLRFSKKIPISIPK